MADRECFVRAAALIDAGLLLDQAVGALRKHVSEEEPRDYLSGSRRRSRATLVTRFIRTLPGPATGPHPNVVQGASPEDRA